LKGGEKSDQKIVRYTRAKYSYEPQYYICASDQKRKKGEKKEPVELAIVCIFCGGKGGKTDVTDIPNGRPPFQVMENYQRMAFICPCGIETKKGGKKKRR